MATTKLTKDDLSYITHILGMSFNETLREGVSTPRKERVKQIKNKVEQMWLNFEEDN